MFVPDFLCSDFIGGFSSHALFKDYISFPSRAEVLVGNFKFNSSLVIEPRLGSFDRFKGCLFSCSDSQVVQTSPRFSVSGPGVPVCGASVRAQGLSVGVHESGSDGRRVSPQAGSLYILLPRRMAYSSRVKKPSFILSFSCVTQGARSGVPGELKKVIVRPSESTNLFGSNSGYSKETSMACGTQSSGTSKFNARVSVKASCDGSEVAGFLGSPGKHGNGFSLQ